MLAEPARQHHAQDSQDENEPGAAGLAAVVPASDDSEAPGLLSDPSFDESFDGPLPDVLEPGDPGIHDFEPLPIAGGYGAGLDLGFWGWLSYLRTPQRDRSTFWAWEAELDITKTFSDNLAASADIDFTDTPHNEATSRIEQLFLSILLSNECDTIITAGKFNAPFGIEARDFWDRLTGTTSFLFRAQPQDLTGIMVTQPLCDSRVIIRPFVVNGFDHNLDVNEQPSMGLMTEFRPHSDVTFAVTNWWGPEFDDENGDKMYFIDAQASWWATPSLSLSAEWLLATTESPMGHLKWSGVMALVNYDCTDRWRVYGRWSYLRDRDGFVTGVDKHQHELSGGLAYYLHELVELRLEYRHNYIQHGDDRDMYGAHLTFGY